ncbi:MurR/RpiR family transcriptional regulator [Pseudonocardia kujensis]|uniref:MurR/RpiR family transcriptional regulator n=1 Tax=Pseudonocardia kujensis TaxID=1128675 RepID=UPI001E4A7E6F|nr:MurR/RpiR family transcriptional regulator [Pseudonocardia kujensis]MCE0768078.1 MurR/RpiR family transcriptional regulator [Pseudonocardia kujensis]
MSGRSTSIAVQLRDKIETLSPSERKVARAILAEYPIAGLETVAELAKRAQVSPPTVIRFTSKIGFDGYAAFQKTLVREVHEALGSPLEQYDRPDVEADWTTTAAGEAFCKGVANTFGELPNSEVDATVSLLTDPRRRIFLVGGTFSGLIATYMARHLQLLRPGVDVVPEARVARQTFLCDRGRSDVVLVFDYRRYDADTVEFAQQASERGTTIVLFTDRWMSPAASVASIVLPAHVEIRSPFDSLVPAMAVVEDLLAVVAQRLGSAGRVRLEQIESLRLVH